MTIKNAIWKFINKGRTGSKLLALRTLARHGHLADNGWFESVFRSMPIDRQGNPIPWYTYPVIRFLAARVKPEMTVFEFGSGNSTLWWSQRVAKVVTCEHDRQWFELMKPRLPASVTYVQADLSAGDEYVTQALQTRHRYDIVAIDGRNRVKCARNSIEALAAGGVILWDNTDREEYREGFVHLAQAGFKQLDFWGMCPIVPTESCTSIFYRDDNSLGL